MKHKFRNQTEILYFLQSDSRNTICIPSMGLYDVTINSIDTENLTEDFHYTIENINFIFVSQLKKNFIIKISVD